MQDELVSDAMIDKEGDEDSEQDEGDTPLLFWRLLEAEDLV